MISSISSVQSLINYNNKNNVVALLDFNSFPTSCICRYDLFYSNGRLSSTGTQITTENTQINRLINKQTMNGLYDLVTRATTTTSNQLKLTGLGYNKPCVYMRGSTISQIGFSTRTNHPQFLNAMEMICVIRPTPGGTSANGWRQNLLTKTLTNIPYPFDIQTNGCYYGNGSATFTVGTHHPDVNWLTTPTQGYIYGNHCTKATGKFQERKNGQLLVDTTLANISLWNDSNNYELLINGKRDNTVQCSFEMGEMLLFTQALTDEERYIIEGYLSTKWGIPLINTHPYYNTSVNYTGINP